MNEELRTRAIRKLLKRYLDEEYNQLGDHRIGSPKWGLLMDRKNELNNLTDAELMAEVLGENE